MTMTVVAQIPNPAAILFGEDQGRYVVTTRDPDRGPRDRAMPPSCSRSRSARPAAMRWRSTWSAAADEQSVALADLRAAHEGFFPKLMGSELTPEF